MYRLQAEVEKLADKLETAVFQSNQAKTAAEYVKTHENLTAQQLKEHAELVYGKLGRARNGCSENKFSYEVTIDYDNVNRLNAELDAMEALLARHNIKAAYANNTIGFVEVAAAKRKTPSASTAAAKRKTPSASTAAAKRKTTAKASPK